MSAALSNYKTYRETESYTFLKILEHSVRIRVYYTYYMVIDQTLRSFMVKHDQREKQTIFTLFCGDMHITL